MAALLEPLQAAGDQRQHFHATYQRTTIAVAEELKRGGFADTEWVEQWDVAFADLYLDALEAALAGGEPTRPWSIAFGAPAGLPPLRHVLLGMNAHINYDLPQALLAVISDEQFDDPALLARREADHRAIDNVLASRVAAEDDELTSLSGHEHPARPAAAAVQPARHPALPARGTAEGMGQRDRAEPRAQAGPGYLRRRPGPAGRTQRRQGRGPAGPRPGPAQARRHRLRRPAAGPGRAGHG